MTTAPAPTVALHIVASRDVYDTRRCASCRRPAAELDVLVISEQGRKVTHYHCAAQRLREAAAPPIDDERRCWFTSWHGQDSCPLPIARTPLCAAHDAILYGAPSAPKKRSAAR